MRLGVPPPTSSFWSRLWGAVSPDLIPWLLVMDCASGCTHWEYHQCGARSCIGGLHTYLGNCFILGDLLEALRSRLGLRVRNTPYTWLRICRRVVSPGKEPQCPNKEDLLLGVLLTRGASITANRRNLKKVFGASLIGDYTQILSLCSRGAFINNRGSSSVLDLICLGL